VKPGDYDGYATVYDLFSAPRLNPLLGRFVDALAEVEQRCRAALAMDGRPWVEDAWLAYRAALERFNAGLATRRFCLLRSEDIASLAATSGFEVEQSDPPFHFLRRGIESIRPGPPVRGAAAL